MAFDVVQDLLADLARGKVVLDVGCAGGLAARTHGRWLHGRLVSAARSVMGVDIAENGINTMRSEGFDVVCADAVAVSMDRQFDLIVAGELIEHIDNARGFLLNMARHLNAGGILALTTPNPFYVMHWIETVLGQCARRWNPEHVCWYCEWTLGNLLRRNGFRVPTYTYATRSRKLARILRALRLSCPRLLASTIIVQATRAAVDGATSSDDDNEAAKRGLAQTAG